MCFSLETLREFLIWVVILCAVVALIQLLIRFIRPRMAGAGVILDFVVAALWIVFWAFVAIAAITFVFDLIACLGPSLPRLR